MSGPTPHAAGSLAKIEVLALRAAAKLPLHHPGDNPAIDLSRLPDKVRRVFGSKAARETGPRPEAAPKVHKCHLDRPDLAGLGGE